MITWNKYTKSDGEWAEVGAFILEASTNGSWVVRHKTGALPCKTSADTGIMRACAIEAAKAACVRALSEITHMSDVQVTKLERIVRGLCQRYESARAQTGEDREAALVDLDLRVRDYLNKHAK